MKAETVSILLGGWIALAALTAAALTAVMCLPLLLGGFYLLGAAFAQLIARAVRRVHLAPATRPDE